MLQLPGRSGTIRLLFELSPERVFTFIVNRAKYNSFTFRYEPWALEVFCKDFGLQYVQRHLEGKQPLLKENKYVYTKEE